LIPNGWRQADRRDVGTMLFGSLIGVPISAWALTRMDPLTVRWMIVALIVPMLALLMSGWRYGGTPTMPLHCGRRRGRRFFQRRGAGRRSADHAVLAARQHCGTRGSRWRRW
jgi:hypothetical protein